MNELLSESTARQVIRNVKATIRQYAEKNGHADGGIIRKGFIESVDELVKDFGKRIAGSALEEARKGVVFEQPWLYYDAPPGSEYDEAQDDFIDDFIESFMDLIDEAQKLAEEYAEEDYKRYRKNLQRLIKRRKIAGKDLSGIKIPKIPKKITAGSVRRLLSEIEKVKAIRL